MNEIVITNTNGELTTSSLGVAEKFGKQHKDVLEKIRNIRAEMNSAEFSAQYFIESVYIDNSGKSNKCYELTRDGFSLLVMGFTGKKALEWKLKYIEAFNLMEQKLRQQSERKMSANELIFEMAKNNLETEKRLNSIEMKQQAIEERTEKVLNVFTTPIDTAWHKAVINQFKKICYENHLNYGTTLGSLYSELENKVHCNLDSRQRNKKKRMKAAGHTSALIEKETKKIMLIEEDDAPRVAFEDIFRKFQVKYIN